MGKYTPPPQDLSHLNALQRYMQKGQLEGTDWAYLLIFVLAYFAARPAIQRGLKWWLASEELREGELAQQEYRQSKARVSPNTIRGTEIQEAASIRESVGDKTTGSSLDKQGSLTNRKEKDNSVTDALLEWDDQPERKATEGDKTDVVAWMNRWATEE